MILRIFWLIANSFFVDTLDWRLKNLRSSQVIPSSVRWIPEVLVKEEETLEDAKILLIIDASE